MNAHMPLGDRRAAENAGIDSARHSFRMQRAVLTISRRPPPEEGGAGRGSRPSQLRATRCSRASSARAGYGCHTPRVILRNNILENRLVHAYTPYQAEIHRAAWEPW